MFFSLFGKNNINQFLAELSQSLLIFSLEKYWVCSLLMINFEAKRMMPEWKNKK